jgi:hypothetical protein
LRKAPARDSAADPNAHKMQEEVSLAISVSVQHLLDLT